MRDVAALESLLILLVGLRITPHPVTIPQTLPDVRDVGYSLGEMRPHSGFITFPFSGWWREGRIRDWCELASKVDALESAS